MKIALLAFAVFSLACSRVPEEPNPVVKEMRPMPGRTGPDVSTAPAPTSDPVAACPKDPEPSQNDKLYDHGEAKFVTPDGTEHKFKVEIARTEAAQQRGLMYRTSLADDAGMVFPFDVPHHATFWMHNTCIALDMVFVSEDNLVIGVVTAPPLNDASREVSGLSKYVVELAAGVAKKRGIAMGTRFVAP